MFMFFKMHMCLLRYGRFKFYITFNIIKIVAVILKPIVIYYSDSVGTNDKFWAFRNLQVRFVDVQ